MSNDTSDEELDILQQRELIHAAYLNDIDDICRKYTDQNDPNQPGIVPGELDSQPGDEGGLTSSEDEGSSSGDSVRSGPSYRVASLAQAQDRFMEVFANALRGGHDLEAIGSESEAVGGSEWEAVGGSEWEALGGSESERTSESEVENPPKKLRLSSSDDVDPAPSPPPSPPSHAHH